MPELPEVETTRRGIEPHILGHRVKNVIVRERRLRWPVPKDFEKRLTGQVIESVKRRSKYILLGTGAGTVIIHLGMSGSLRVVTNDAPPALHDHIDLVISDDLKLRFRDPRRFGCFLWCAGETENHKLLRNLGPEPLENNFDGDHLYRLSRGRKVAVKNFIMDAAVVVGVGNIYASESLSCAGIHPARAAGRISRARYIELARCIREILNRSIRLGGTTLRDFVNAAGEPGYFEQTLRVYGRAGQPCRQCGAPIRSITLGQRSSFYCSRCQK